MEAFLLFSSKAAPLLIENIDTDMIIPKQFLKTLKRTGLGKYLFYDLRYDQKGQENPDFVLNQDTYKASKILIGGSNFGCGSSREHAQWALLDFGFRCIIAPSFADIFKANCHQNRILAITLPIEIVQLLAMEKGFIKVCLKDQTVESSSSTFSFSIDAELKNAFIEGRDFIETTLEQIGKIEAWESAWINSVVYPPSQ